MIPKFLFASFFLCFIVLSNSCRKNVSHINKDYIGNWSEVDSGGQVCRLSIIIDPNGYAKAESKTTLSDCRRYGAHKGKARADKQSLKIGTKVYKLIEPPTAIDAVKVKTDLGEGVSNMRMQLDNLVLFKLLK